jgi:hypothetical protein
MALRGAYFEEGADKVDELVSNRHHREYADNAEQEQSHL